MAHRTENVVLTNMCMVYDGDKILVQDRKDPGWQGIAFPGGHIEKGESIVDSVIREVYEETGLKIENVRICGVSQWTAKDNSYRYIVFFFKTNCFSGELRPSEEGEVFWIDRKDLSKHKLAGNFERKLEVFEDDSVSENFYWFEEGQWKFENK
ncbi:MAG: 8-oxo-dGTP diphosphatase [Clostridia bacterium]|nr:8-oxo-dGTP diphosphatase [Clostridia bacterium]